MDYGYGEQYEAFVANHKDTKWVQILTQDGKHVAFTLAVEAATRISERLRKFDYNFEFLNNYPGGVVISVHLYGRKLPNVEAMASRQGISA